MIGRNARARQHGFSMLELSIVLVVSSIIGLFLWRWFAIVAAPMARPQIESQLSEAQTAVEGFVLSYHRLPCAAVDHAGLEECSASAGRSLPWRTLGLSSDYAPLGYGVNQGGGFNLAAQPSLAALPWSSVSPDMGLDYTQVLELPEPPDVSDLGGSPSVPNFVAAQSQALQASEQVQEAIERAAARRTQVNGLDWCQVLRRYASAEQTPQGALMAGNGTQSVPLAYIVVHPGSNLQWDGNNSGAAQNAWDFDLPGRAQDVNYDDISLAVGPADLSARIGCVERLGQMQSAAQTAYAAWDATRVMLQHWQFRSADVESKVSDYDSARTGIAMSAMGLALATASSVLGIASAANTEGVTAYDLVNTAVNLAMAVADVTMAALALEEAEDSLHASAQKILASNDYAIHVYGTLRQALEQAIALDQKGLNP